MPGASDHDGRRRQLYGVIARHVIATPKKNTGSDRNAAVDEADTQLARELAAGHWYGVYRRPVDSIDSPSA
jgi:hypothetical protein